MVGECSECGRTGRIRKGLCDAHYFRQWRGRGVGSAVVAIKRPGATCSIQGCTAPAVARTWCQMHYTRYLRNGDPGITKSPTRRHGTANNMWAGADIGYGGVHQRVRRALGRASTYLCPCGEPADHWAYDHADQDERRSEDGLLYSTDLAHYMPMCARCHRRLDRDHRQA
jgi:hypothetical protein